ncbi:NADP-dependent malic enzyme [Candidatus Micrarchaeota archaeon]|nr:NADP-dependent malic enzyme [Candidatus Micrarchaeota archaeon]MBU1886794.1 NADP-dependent malic enzyme [Candidatus Micrarchaeota archaeon]
MSTDHDYNKESLEIHRKIKGKLSISAKTPIKNMHDMSVLYTPGVAEPCRHIAKDKVLAYDLTMKHNTVAIVSDGTRVLGLGDIGPEAALPVMEGKALIMQQFAGIDAFPVCLDEKDSDKIVEIVKAIAPNFGAINLEDISTPKVFHIEARLIKELDIPVFHDDQHGTAVVVLAGLINAMKLTKKTKIESVQVGIIGSGAAGYGIARLLHAYGFRNVVVFDSKGALHNGRTDLVDYKKDLVIFTNPSDFKGKISEFKDAEIIISAASPGALPIETIRAMKKPNIVFALANPVSEISLEQAKELGIDIFGTGRSDCPNQINNSLCFPGFLRALLDLRITKITDKMKIAAAKGIAASLPESQLSKDRIVPDPFEPSLAENIKKAISGL